MLTKNEPTNLKPEDAPDKDMARRGSSAAT